MNCAECGKRVVDYQRGFADASQQAPWWAIAIWSLVCFALGAAIF